jgi:WD40 repeat protein
VEAHAITRLVFDSAGRGLIALGKTATPELFDMHGGSAFLFDPTGPNTGPRDAAVFPGGLRVVIGGEDAIARVWNHETGRITARLKHDAPINGVAVNGDGTRVATASDDGTVRIWDPVSGGEVGRCAAHAGAARRVAFSKDGKRTFSVGADGVVAICDALGHRIRVLRADGESFRELLISPGETYIAARSEDAVYLWELSRYTFLRAFRPSWNTKAMGLDDHRVVVGATAGFEASPIELETRAPADVEAFFRGRSPWTIRDMSAAADSNAAEIRSGPVLELVTEEGAQEGK